MALGKAARYQMCAKTCCNAPRLLPAEIAPHSYKRIAEWQLETGLKPILPAVLCCLKFLIEPAILSLFLRIWPCPETCKWSLLLMGLAVVRILLLKALRSRSLDPSGATSD